MNGYALLNPVGEIVKHGTKKACEALCRYWHALHPAIKFVVVRVKK
jgi:hypothetical protein